MEGLTPRQCYFCGRSAEDEPLLAAWQMGTTVLGPKVAHVGCVHRIAAFSNSQFWNTLFYEAWGLSPVPGG